MGLSKPQWEALLAEIEETRNQSLTESQVDAYYRNLRDIPFDRMRHGVDHLIRYYRGYQFPSVAVIRDHCEKSRNEGFGGAEAYGNRPLSPKQTSETHFLVWRQSKIQDLSDDDYWRYIQDEAFKRQKESEWRQEWRDGGEKSA